MVYPSLIQRKVPALVAQLVECPLRDREVPESIPGRDIPKSLTMVLVASRWDFRGMARTVRSGISIM